MRVGCLFGTFDPPHYGHTAVAAHMLAHAGLDAVWLVVSPQNPFKRGRHLTPDAIRLELVRRAVEGLEGLEASGVELDLPKPSYTADALAHMRERWPGHEFALIIGSDNLAGFDRWKDPQEILAHHDLLVYPRPGVELHFEESAFADHPRVHVVDAPFLTISSTRVRDMVSRGQDVGGLVPPGVLAAIRGKGLYQATEDTPAE
ncbi:MAG: nicotinate (nicotinamide) nucleotide adenylyltransferase [Flavobacteriales bacterium]|nr:nicotinate-nucleotide adenylyltransferase [Flavobacteriales bacterium]MCB0783229.1 nicotinate-nucleotide adenylyltransferase [Flavobacteriales bacterium]MCB0788076.1 nicotinate-nucleotide adenylyltransferase [Flavobacteriales bacterium]MCB0807653.1 nicotinate-nucleotide adenylyltransferase [Flavobacteriales bacterium]MCB0811860.1 nicotinate-nucleotide adenylyltransferase [Flavobacteriales bacterium]